MDARSYIARLQRRGFVTLGAGAFSTVLGKPGYSRVIKVGRGQPDGWVDYVMWADKAGYAGSFAPKVFSLKIYWDDRVSGPNGWSGRPIERDTFYVATMERLGDTVAKRWSKPEYTLYQRMCDAIYGREDARIRNAIEASYPGGYAFIKAFKDAALSDAYDMHDGNWMMRGDQLVLTDPLASTAGTSTKRWRASTSTAIHPHLVAVNAALADVAARALIAR